MLKKIILLENEEEIQCNSLEEIIQILIDENYYKMSKKEKEQKLEILALANSLNKKIEIIGNEKKLKEIDEFEGKIIIKDEVTYILSLLVNNLIVLLEEKNANIFMKNMDKSSLNGNYIIVNKFAKDLLRKYE